MKRTKNQEPYVWLVSYYFGFGYHDHERLFLTEAEARAFYDSLDVATHKDIYQVRDIWGWSEKQKVSEERDYLSSLLGSGGLILKPSSIVKGVTP